MTGADSREASSGASSPLTSARGTYALMLRCPRAGRVRVGRLGTLSIEEGGYIYIGSAFGPGGLRSRVSRHAALGKVKRWHIDYIRPRMTLSSVWFSSAAISLEHDWATKILALPGGKIPLPRFGASDCRCATHLVQFDDLEIASAQVTDVLAAAADPVGQMDAGSLRALARRRR